jgi:thiol-disulfide isomerase/thioredoxin
MSQPKRHRRLLFGMVALVALAAGLMVSRGYLQYWYLHFRDAGNGMGQSEPLIPFTLEDLDGIQHPIDEWSGKVRVINFWATWCPPCQEEIPMFQALQEQYGDLGLQFIGIALDQRDAVANYRDELLIEYPLLLGGRTALDLMGRLGNLAGVLPYSVVVDRDGNIRDHKMGAYQREELEKLVRPLVLGSDQ